MREANERLRQKAQNEQTCIALNDLLKTKDAAIAAKDAEIARQRRIAEAMQEKEQIAQAERTKLALQLAAQPARQVGGDEREQFEAWRMAIFCGGEDRLKKCSNAPDVYYYTAEQEAWKVWQARAALAPAAVESRDDKTLITETIGFEFKAGELQTVNANDLFRLVVAARAKSSATVVMPQRARVIGFGGDKVAEAYNCALDEVARLNRRAIPAGLLERIASVELLNDWPDMRELRALLGKEGE